MKAVLHGTVVAESDDTVVVEGNHYFPRSSVRADVLHDSSTKTRCSWKGEASYYSLVVDDGTVADAACYYPAPLDAAAQITDRLAFWKGVKVFND